MTIAALQIPLTPVPQRFSIQLAGIFYDLSFRWNAPGNSWVMDIGNSSGEPLIAGIPLVTGADLLEQYKYVGIGGQMIVQSDDNVDAVPTADNLGSISHLYFIPDA